jgi:hypothetical protein
MERRRGKERRKHIDPRYRNVAYSEFVDSREVDRRKPPYEDSHPFVREHPIRKWVVLISVVIAIFLVYIFFFTCLIVSSKCPGKRVRQRTITLGYHQDYSGNQWAAMADLLGYNASQKCV